MKRAVFSSVVALVAVLPLLLPAYAFFSVLAAFGGDFPASAHAECGVVFGAAVHGGDRAGPGILRRVGAGVRLYQEKKIDRLIMTGGRGSDDQESEASVMKDVALTSGVDASHVLSEELSTSTWENVRNILPFLDECDGVVGISDRYHLARIRLLAEKQGIDLFTYPADPPPRTFFEIRSVVREAGGYLVYLFMPGVN